MLNNSLKAFMIFSLLTTFTNIANACDSHSKANNEKKKVQETNDLPKICGDCRK